MSRYTINGYNPNLLIVVGFDPPLQTFFLQVDTYNVPDDADPCICWLGTTPGEIPTVQALATVVQPYATLSPEVQTHLQADYEARTTPTPLQRHMIRLLQPLKTLP